MSGYDTDILEWSEHQAELLRRLAAGERVNDQVDWENIIEEVLGVGNAARDKLEARIGTIIEHLIKLQASPATNPRAKWKLTILAARRDIVRILKRAGNLEDVIPGIVTDETQPARQDAAKALAFFDETPIVDINGLSYTPDQVVGDWFPDGPC